MPENIPRPISCTRGHHGPFSLVRSRKEYYPVLRHEPATEPGGTSMLVVHYEDPKNACVDQDAYLECEAEDGDPKKASDTCLAKVSIPKDCRLAWDDEAAPREATPLDGPDEGADQGGLNVQVQPAPAEEDTGLKTTISAFEAGIAVDFSKPIDSLRFSPEEAQLFAKALLDKCAEVGDARMDSGA